MPYLIMPENFKRGGAREYRALVLELSSEIENAPYLLHTYRAAIGGNSNSKSNSGQSSSSSSSNSNSNSGSQNCQNCRARSDANSEYN